MRESIINSIRSSFNEVWGDLPASRKLITGVAVAAVIAGIVSLALWSSRPDYAVLFSGIDTSNADLATKAIEAKNIPFDTLLQWETAAAEEILSQVAEYEESAGRERLQNTMIKAVVVISVLVFLTLVLLWAMRRRTADETPVPSERGSSAVSPTIAGGDGMSMQDGEAGPILTEDVVERISSDAKAFDLLTSVPGSTDLLLEMIQDEHPQTIALILSHIREGRAAEILGSLPPDMRTEVVTRIANMTAVSSEIISEIEKALQAKLQSYDRVKAGGVKNAAEILNRVDPEVRIQIMKSIASANPDLAEKIGDLGSSGQALMEVERSIG